MGSLSLRLGLGRWLRWLGRLATLGMARLALGWCVGVLHRQRLEHHGGVFVGIGQTQVFGLLQLGSGFLVVCAGRGRLLRIGWISNNLDILPLVRVGVVDWVDVLGHYRHSRQLGIGSDRAGSGTGGKC